MKIKRSTFNRWRRIFIRATILAIFFGAFYLYFRTNFFTIYTYEIVGAPLNTKSEIQNKIQELSTQSIYKFIPTNKIFTYRGLKIKAIIKEKLPNTDTVSISVRSLHTLRITITPYSPLFRMNENEAITKDGYIFTSTEDINNLPKLVVASSTIKTENKDGLISSKLILENATSTEALFDAIVNIIPKINTVLFNVTNINVLPYGDVIISDESMKSSVKLSFLVNLDKEWSNVISAIDTEPLKGLLETKKDQLEYIDVRFDNKVFYKFTNTFIPTIINASTTKNYVQNATTTIPSSESSTLR
ncbi:MAG: hypothetical protein WCK60_02110 [Candidatus Nomurabacteria bacterium]